MEQLLGAAFELEVERRESPRPGAFGAAVGRLRPRVRAATRARLRARRGRRGVAQAGVRDDRGPLRGRHPHASSSSGGGADRGRLPPRRGNRPAAAAAAAEHGHPPATRRSQPSCCAATSRQPVSRSSSTRHAGARQPRRAPARRQGEPASTSSRTPTPSSPTRIVVARPVVGRPRRRPRQGPQRPDHEEPGRGERRRVASLAREGFQTVRRPRLRRGRGQRSGRRSGCSGCEEHPDAVRVDYASNEGGGERIDVGGKPLYLRRRGEMSAPFRLRVRGRTGMRRCRGSRTTHS